MPEQPSLASVDSGMATGAAFAHPRAADARIYSRNEPVGRAQGANSDTGDSVQGAQWPVVCVPFFDRAEVSLDKKTIILCARGISRNTPDTHRTLVRTRETTSRSSCNTSRSSCPKSLKHAARRPVMRLLLIEEHRINHALAATSAAVLQSSFGGSRRVSNCYHGWR